MSAENGGLYTAKEIAGLAAVTPAAVIQFFYRKGFVPAATMGRTTLWSEAQKDEYLSGRQIRKQETAVCSGRLAAVREKYKNGIPPGEIERWIMSL